MNRRILILGVVCAFSLPVFGEPELRIAAWNIANLHHEAGVESRPRIGTRRSEADFDCLFSYAEQVSPDVIALQEIATPEAVHRLFPADEYATFMSSRYEEERGSGDSVSGIYTAIAVRKRPDITVEEQADIVDLEIPYGDGRSTRRGTAILLNIDGQKLWFTSVHLKSSCATTRAADQSTSEDCRILWGQQAPLRAWIDERLSENVPFIVAGDFNRRFRQFGFQGPVFGYLAGEDSDEPDLVAFPEYVTRKCPTRKGSSTEPIDWILVDASIAHWVKPDSFWETRFTSSDVRAHGGQRASRLSDHCPIHLDLAL